MAESPYLQWLAGSLSSAPERPLDPYAGDAVIGYAVGYGVLEIAPFVRSLRAVFAGRIVLQERWGAGNSPGRVMRRKSLRQRVATLGSSVMRRLPELR